MNEKQISLIPIRFYDFGPAWQEGLNSIYLQSQLHGDEALGTLVLLNLLKTLSSLPEDAFTGSIRVVPRANPCSYNYYLYGREGTFEPSTGRNWNRIFDWASVLGGLKDAPSASGQDFWLRLRHEASKRIESASDITTRLSMALLSLSAGFAIIVDLHTPEYGAAHLYCSNYTTNTPTFTIPYIVIDRAPYQHSFYQEHLRVAALAALPSPVSITIELPSYLPMTNNLVEEWTATTLRELSVLGFIDKACLPHYHTSEPHSVITGSLIDYQTSVGGIPKYHVELGKPQPQGSLLAEVVTADSILTSDSIIAESACTPLCLRRYTMVQPGAWVMRVLVPGAMTDLQD